MHPRGLLHSDAMVGRRKSPDETMKSRYLGIPAFGTWIESPGISALDPIIILKCAYLALVLENCAITS